MQKILIVDDEIDVLAVLKKYLQDEYDIVEATNGRQALEVYDQERPCVVITDIRMPGMDGIELIRQIKEREGNAEVIAITGHGDAEIGEESMRLGASDFLTKPVDVGTLEEAIDRAFSKFREF